MLLTAVATCATLMMACGDTEQTTNDNTAVEAPAEGEDAGEEAPVEGADDAANTDAAAEGTDVAADTDADASNRNGRRLLFFIHNPL